MDGNRRWARQRSLPTLLGHSAGYDKVKDLVNWSLEKGIKHLILYAFSMENWKRDSSEVDYLMKIIESFFKKEEKTIKEKDIKIKIIGEMSLVPKTTLAALENIQKKTKNNKGLCFVLAISYGGRLEILSAVKKISEEKSKKEIKSLTEKQFSKFMWSRDIPDPDLVIRTSGEMRLSNFLPWQSTYSELFFIKTLWPDFSKKEFMDILDEFSLRQRRFGK